MFGRFDVETTNDATLPFKNAGFKELPDCLFKILPNHLQKCQNETLIGIFVIEMA